jgi:hypothetical protein
LTEFGLKQGKVAAMRPMFWNTCLKSWVKQTKQLLERQKTIKIPNSNMRSCIYEREFWAIYPTFI